MRIFKYIAILGITLLFSCTGSKPENTIKEFFKAIDAHDYETAKTLTTKKSQATIDFLEKGVVNLDLGNGKLKNVDCVQEGEINNCDCFFDGNTKPIPISLVKEDNEWKVDIQTTAENLIENVMDKLKGVDVDGLLDKLDINGDNINDFIQNIDADLIINTIENIDSSKEEIGSNLKDIVKDIKEGLDKSE